MQENRSFDHYWHAAGVRGFGDRFVAPGLPRCKQVAPAACGCNPMPVARGRSHRSRWIPPRTSVHAVEGTPHTWPDAQRAWDHGRMGHWPKAKQNHSMATQRSDLPFQFALADAFNDLRCVPLRHAGRHQPNRVFLWTGHNDAQARAGGPVIANSHDNFPEHGGHPASYRWTSYVERLQNAGVSWQIYQDSRQLHRQPAGGFRGLPPGPPRGARA